MPVARGFQVYFAVKQQGTTSSNISMSRSSPAEAPDQLVEDLLQVLRHLWLGQPPMVRLRQNALVFLHKLRDQAAASHQIGESLDAMSQRVRSLAGNEPDIERKATVQGIADELKALRPLLGIAAPAPEVGKLNSAIRTPKAAPPKPAKPVPAKPQPVRAVKLDDLVDVIPGIGASGARQLGNLSIATVGDLLRHTPRAHVDYAHPRKIAAVPIPPGWVVYRGVIRSIKEIYGRGKARVEAVLRDDTGSIQITWFSTYIAKQIKEGDEIVVRGTVKSDRHGFALSPIEWERADNPEIVQGRLIPIYPLTKGLAQKRLRGWTHRALQLATPSIVDWMGEIRSVTNRVLPAEALLPLDQAYEQLHYPDSLESLEQARNRLAFEMYLLLQIGLIEQKAQAKAQRGVALPADGELNNLFRSTLPFQLTSAQDRALSQILGDLRTGVPMTRLLQGDVGTGKTVVAALAALATFANGYQTAVMAPTEILAEQHFRSFESAFAGLPDNQRPRIALLTGSTKKKARTEIAAGLASGAISALIGTHAIIEDHVQFEKLGLVVIDEQHRFGVHQRGLLLQKADGWTPHVLSMTATPIPKTLNHVVHGDLDVSIIDQKPPGRVEIETRLYGPPDRRDAYRLVRQEIEAGHQVFVICPLVEEAEAEDPELAPPTELVRSRRDAKAAVNEAERLQADVFPDLRITVLHGQMPSKKKDEVMTAFRNHEFDILVATSVIEVGIDVPNATIVMIEGADRFGLSQLHQLRGRVGRGSAKSYCLLLAEETSAVADERLQAMVSTTDGFVLAQKDLELRGPGDFIGTRQSGMPEMDWIGTGFDSRLLDQAHQVAELVLADDPQTLKKRYPQLAQQVALFWQSTESLDTTKA
jgi:ATP-dependent DNA helicase RecG